MTNEVSLANGLIIAKDRHPSVQHMAPLFAFGHLPPALGQISAQFAHLAQYMVNNTIDGPELTETLRKLWEAKNCAVVHAGFLGGLIAPEIRPTLKDPVKE